MTDPGFPRRGGGRPQKVYGANLLFLQFSSENYMKLKRNLTKRGLGMCGYQAPWDPLMLGNSWSWRPLTGKS